MQIGSRSIGDLAARHATDAVARCGERTDLCYKERPTTQVGSEE